MCKLQCIQYTLRMIVTQASPILKKLHWLPVEFWCVFKTAKFLHSDHPNHISPHLSIHCRWYGTRYNRPDKRFLEVPQFYPSVHTKKNNTLVTALLLMFQHSGMICLMMSCSNSCLFLEKTKILSL